MDVRKITCIGCPMGCCLNVEIEKNTVISVSGNACKRGEDYAKKELTHPTRIVTSTVPVKNGMIPVVSVKTKEGISK